MDPLALESYDYKLPKERIATHPIMPKESAKLLVYERKSDTIVHTTFKNFIEFIPKESLLVFNNTKVIPARIYGIKITKDSKSAPINGAKIEALYHKELGKNRYLMQFKGRLKEQSCVKFHTNIFARILKEADVKNGVGFKEAEFYSDENFIKPLESSAFFGFLEQYGHIPLPPYIKREDNRCDRDDYQSVFAKHLGAIAAPTASLHFSDGYYAYLLEHFKSVEITLHTGAGTFVGVQTQNILEHIMHKESYHITQDAQKQLKEAKHITAIGTTSARCVEYFLRTNKGEGECDLFLHPKNPAQYINALLTNFHLPKTTLLMLVASFIGLSKTQELYKEAILKEYRFYSYGDGMLIL